MDREKVIKGLECHHIDELNRINCSDCPYYKEDDIAMDCLNSMHADAIAMLKENNVETEWCERCGRVRLKSKWEGR